MERTIVNLPRLSLLAATLALLAAGLPAEAPAAGDGFAYDSLTKFVAGNDAPPPPGSFASDFQVAANPPPAGDSPKLPFGLGKSMGQMQAAMSLFKAGTAERHYIAGNKYRVDHIALNTAEITDCGARTLTTLNLKDKTYTVVSLEQPESHEGGDGAPGKARPALSDDRTKVAVSLTTRALGEKTLDGTPASGYDANFKTTITKAGGDTQSFAMETTAYYAGIAQPSEYCNQSHAGVAGMMPGGGASAMAAYQTAMRAVREAKGNPRFTVTSSGPDLPAGKFALYELITMKGEHGSFNMLMERGDVHSIGESDPVFSVPPDFAKT
jgi:hypothetical protein